MKQTALIFCVASLLTAASPVLAENSPQPVIPISQYPAMNLVHYEISVEQWVTTKTALVTVGIDANLNQEGLDKLQPQINDTLKNLASNATWQMTDYERTEDASGLEQVHVEEQARLTADALNNLRSKSKNLSQPGVKYTITNIDFSPSLADTQAAVDALRSQLYSRVAQEIVLLNKTYGQTFYVHDLQFSLGGDGGRAPMPMAMNAMVRGAVRSAPQGPMAAMSQKWVMSADVTLASTVK